jgi:hypothetical protein
MEAPSRSSTQECLNILRNLKIQYPAHKSNRPVSISRQKKPVDTIPTYFLNVSLNVILLMSRSSEWSLSLWLSHHVASCVPLISYTRHLSSISHSPWSDHSKYNWRRVQVMKLLITQCSPILYNFTHLRLKRRSKRKCMMLITGTISHCIST